MVSDTFLRLPYSVLLVVFADQFTFNTIRSIRVYEPSNDCSSLLVRDQVAHPYIKMVSVVALNSCQFVIKIAFPDSFHFMQ